MSDRFELAPGYSISRLINGCWQLSEGHQSRASEAGEVVDAWIRLAEAGFTTFDCADIYTGVEELLGRFLQSWRAGGRDPESIQIHTKYVPDVGALASLDRRQVSEIVERSLSRLGVERLDLVQFAWWDYSVPGWTDAAGWLDELRVEGKIRLLGATNFDTPRLTEILDAGVPLVAHQVQYSLLDRRPQQGMAELCVDRGVSLLTYGGLAGGFLSDRWLGAGEPAEALANRSLVKYRLIIEEFGGWEPYQRLLAILGEIARDRGVPIGSVAVRWVLERPAVAAVIAGARSDAHLEENLRLLELTLERDEIDALDTACAGRGQRGTPSAWSVSRTVRTPRSCGRTSGGPPRARLVRMRDLPIRSLVATLSLILLSIACDRPAPDPQAPAGDAEQALIDNYLETYFATFPTRATAAGRHEYDGELENLGQEERLAWLRYNQEALAAVESALMGDAADADLRMDLELLWRRASRVTMDYEVLRRPRQNPLFWTGILGNATVFLLVRDDLPLEERLESARLRALLIPRLAGQAREALADSAEAMAPEHCRLAARQAAGTASFYRGGFAEAAGDAEPLRAALAEAGESAAAALDELAAMLESICESASGSPRLGHHYGHRFRVVTGLDDSVANILEQAKGALVLKRQETADYGRQVWDEIFPGEPEPADEVELVRRLFQRIGEDGAASIEEYVVDFKKQIDASVQFVRDNDLVTLPEPLTLHTDRSPSYFVGASVGGVYPAGPYAPADAKTLLFVPTPPESASAEAKAAFFRDFNHHFNVMIVPHEIIPGHYLQLKYAASHPRKIRALFGDGVYIEGWGTFSERLMLDEGWGTPLARLAHLKKQLENIARTIVDIRVHTQEMTREEVLAFVQDEALQDAQFAGNMWRRAITSSPQLTSYYLGYAQVRGLFDDVRAARGEDFKVKDFMNGMMEMGPVSVSHYRERMLGSDGDG